MDWRLRRGKAESERTWIGMAVLGEVRTDEARQGMSWRYSAWVDVVKQGPTWLGAAVQGEAWYAQTRTGLERRYMEGMTRKGVRWNGWAVLG